MRVLFAVFPATSHTLPVIPLAWALQNAGHEVRIVTHPDSTGPVTRAGLAAVPVGGSTDLRELADFRHNPALLGHAGGDLSVASPDCPDWGPKWFRMTRVFAGMRPLLEELTGIAVRWRPDLVLWDPFCLPAAVAARLSGAAHARVLWGRDNVAWLRQRSLRYLAQAQGGSWPDPLEEVMQQLLEPYGLTYEEELLLGQWTIDPLPPGVRLPAPDVRYESMRWATYSGGGRVPDWLHSKPVRPRVCLAWETGEPGALPQPGAGASLSEVLASLAELDVELVSTGDPAAPGSDVPGRVRLLDRLPLNQLLPGCSAIVHRGGSAVFSAAAHGVPQLVVPTPFWDEEGTAGYLEHRNAGRVLDRARCDPTTLRDALSALLADHRIHQRAGFLRDELALLPGPSELVPVLERLTSLHQRI
ncbi:nucleotide disphospho-sugar-binding domain-containing protein [Streptomyces sp. NBC_01431]|uniref:nucleotide disphospho-sugar-binding domain-containing protein n=1 Tax=Streptomyces sp. NBC_01431 TaxID=2903863 RepID=UPI002E3718D9|nr:nucleotide disphospho-sugar-binding domain-containing protein [Streptomyces sp. NBC_01431]